MSSRGETIGVSPQLENPSKPYDRLCCLFFNWNDSSTHKARQVDNLQDVLSYRYGAFVANATLDYEDLRDSEKSFVYHIENFLRKYDDRNSLLVIFYSGGSYVHENQLFLTPHQHSKPSILWTEYADRKLLVSAASVLLIFDTTYMKHGHYDNVWERTCDRRIALYAKRNLDKTTALNLLALNGLHTHILTSSLISKASALQNDGVSVTDLYEILKNDPKAFEKPSVYPYQEIDDLPEMKLYPLARPKLRLYQHHVFADPHDEYLKSIETVPLQQDGSCEVVRMRLGTDVQEFGDNPCLVAIKRFTIRPTSRAYLREGFLREKENLVEVSKLNHEHILGMLGTFETRCRDFNTFNLVLPFAEGGNLHEFLRLERDTGWFARGYPTGDPSLPGKLGDWRYAVFRQAIGLVDALANLHDDKDGKFIIHCDIKPANVLIQDRKFKLADFGLSRFKNSDETSKTEWHGGTFLYSPPEREELSGRGRDVWALGCVLLEVAFMIRFSFQEVFHAHHEKYTGLTNMIDIFEKDRKEWAKKEGKGDTAIYHKTMPCVREIMQSFNTMREGLRRRIIVDCMFPIIHKMMEEDQDKIITATDARSALKTHYLGLQSDQQLRKAILENEHYDDPDRWKVFDNVQLPQSGMIRPGMTGHSPFQTDGPSPRPPVQRAITASSIFPSPTMGPPAGQLLHMDARPMTSPEAQLPGSNIPQPMAKAAEFGGPVTALNELHLMDRKRSISTEEINSNKRRWPSPFY